MNFLKYYRTAFLVMLAFSWTRADAQDPDSIGRTIFLSEEEIIYSPFYSKKNKETGAAVSTLATKDLPQIPLGGLNNILAGRVPGLYVQQTGTKPGAESATFRIRGTSTYNSGNNPLVLVDGISRSLQNIDLNEIESFTVLKDAASLSWYGLNGGNGVILVKTKSGKPSRNLINFSSQYGFQQMDRHIPSLDSYTYATLYNEALSNSGQAGGFSQEQLDAYRSGSNPFLYPNNDYKNELMRSSAPVQRYVLSASGGTEAIRYFVHTSYFDQDGLFKNAKGDGFNSQVRFNRLNFRTNLDVNVTKTLSFGLYAAVRVENRNNPGDNETDALINDIYNLPPNAFPLLNEDGTFGGTNTYDNNPLARLTRSGSRRDILRGSFATITAKQKLDFVTKGLSANVLFGYDASGTYTSGFVQDYELYDFSQSPVRIISPVTNPNVGYRASSFSGNNRKNEIWIGLDYDRSFGLHSIDAGFRGQRSVDNDASRLEYRDQQLAARLSYGYKSRYFIDLTGSYAGSENFAPEQRYDFYPAAAIGWIVSDEGFLKASKSVNYLKLRTSYGLTANGGIGGTRLPFRTLYNRNGGGGGYAFGTSFTATTSAGEQNPMGNADIHAERIRRFNIGSDIRFLNNALSLSADYFNERRSDILTEDFRPGILGISLVSVNGGVVSNKGFETSLMFTKTLGKLDLALNGNYTYASNKIIARNELSGTLPYQSTVGHNVGGVTGTGGGKRFYLSDGLFKNQDEIDNSPRQTLSENVYPGDIKYRDINMDGVIDVNDRVETNYTDIPHSYYGFGFNLGYGIFALNAQFQGIQGRTMSVYSLINSGPDRLNTYSLDRWTPETASSARWPRLAAADRGNNEAASDFWLRSADFLKLKTVELGVSLPKDVLRRVRLQRARVFVSGFNVLSFSKIQKDFDIDPEMNYAGYGNDYPNLRTYSLGLNVQF
ncbi:SusC/RagA family TonB-linked outer membrane protein [Desertivirga xinjiangensis]|uniref:SusC/RagA family TonB-linked outer membrane protein n=1 Tax=Desertivirga xinjiangensis TaxID=539206 RepID=UPI00210B94CD|nr:SusC/RagA family TonB-linked outer membrane protein [Pedobacter xinjiangensis]